jgi:hypothetical protein
MGLHSVAIAPARPGSAIRTWKRVIGLIGAPLSRVSCRENAPGR